MTNKTVKFEGFTNEQILFMAKSDTGVQMIMESCKAMLVKASKEVFIGGGENDFEDKFQVASMGLYKAIRSYDADKIKDGDFYSFANRLVRNELYSYSQKYKSQREGFNKETGTTNKPLYLDQTTGDEEEGSLKEMLVDETVDVFTDATSYEVKWSWMLKFLTEKEYQCLVAYYNESGVTYEELANEMGCSRQMVRKFIMKAQEKIKARYNEGELADMLNLR